MANTCSNSRMNPSGHGTDAVLSTEERRLAETIRDWPATPALPPTLDELAERLGLVKSTIHLYRRRLRDLGLVTFEEGKSRSTRITTISGSWPHTI